MKHRVYENNDSTLDVFMNMLMFFLFMFVILLVQANPSKQEKTVSVKAEFVITVQWPDDRNDDVDTYFEDPQGHLVHYRQKAKGLMHLDRDDLGSSNDQIQLPDGRWIKIKTNKEIVTLRGIIKGEYTVNVHLFNKRSNHPEGIPVQVTIEKLNDYKMVYFREVVLEEEGDEITVCRFTLDDEGEVIATNELEKRFTKVNHGHHAGGTIIPAPLEDEGF